MINCLSFSPLSFHSVSQLSRFKFPLFLNSTSTNNNLLFELPSPLISSWPPFRILLLMPMPCFVNYFISLLFPLHPSAFCLLRHLRFDCRHLYLHLSPRLFLFHLILHRSRVRLGCLINSMLCNLRYVVNKLLLCLSCYKLSFPSGLIFSIFRCLSPHLFFTPHTCPSSACKRVSVFTLYAHLSLLIPKQSYYLQ